MIILLFTAAIIMMLLGHIFKTKRWMQFVAVYEKPNGDLLLNSLACGHSLNVLVPFRVGDIFRIYLSGKKMKNGYAFAFATVTIDIFLDIIVVSLVFFFFSLFGVGDIELAKVSNLYSIIFVVLVPLVVVCFIFRKQLKFIIKAVSSIFNKNIEMKILYISWMIISSLKDIVRKLSKVKLILFTFVMWVSYYLSYFCFAKFISLLGLELSTSKVFTILFSKNVVSLFFQSQNNRFSTLLIIYLLIPLFLILIYTNLKRFIKKQKDLMSKTESFRYVLPYLNENEKLGFLELYFSDCAKENYNLYLNINQDVNILRDYSSGSNATTMLCMKQDSTFYRKYAVGSSANKLREQIEWIEKHQDSLPLPRIFNKKIEEEYCLYDMEYNPSTVEFFQFIHSMPCENSWKLLEKSIILIEEKLHTNNVRSSSRESVYSYIKEKVNNNLNIIRNGEKHLRALTAYESIFINGREYPNLEYYEKMLSNENLFNIFSNEKYSDIHGDLTIENIICIQGPKPNFYYIDPNTGNTHESAFLDYSKILQSLHGGYEFLMSTNNVEVYENRISFLATKSSAYSELYEKYKTYLFEKFSFDEVKSIYYHEIVHWLRLMPYKIKKDEKRSIIFYSGLIMVLDDVYNMFK